jgi:hypothetical protein
MSAHDRLRPLKAWRYIGVYGSDMMLCVGSVRIARARQSFWAVWDRQAGALHERTRLGRAGVELAPGRAVVVAGDARIELSFEESAGVETISASGASYAWTRKQGGVRIAGRLIAGGVDRELDARGIIDDTAAYFERHTSWRWWAGVGQATDGRELAWNLVDGVHDAPLSSERTVWVDDQAYEVGPRAFADLRFAPEAVRQRRDNLLLVRSSYRQPFGVFSGQLPGGIELADGYGVTEDHDAWW